jgi:hypothetical protein
MSFMQASTLWRELTQITSVVMISRTRVSRETLPRRMAISSRASRTVVSGTVVNTECPL